MITKLKTTIWAIALLFSVASVMVLSSCGEESEPEPDPVIPPGLSYSATTVAVGAEGSVAAAVTGDAATYEITDGGDEPSFVTVNASTGELSVAAESTTGVYNVMVKATNSEGTDEATAEITIGIGDFDPTGTGYEWQYFINQDDPWTLSGLDGEVAELPFPTVDIPMGWPPDWPGGNADWDDEYLFPYLALGGIAELLMQVPSDIACGAVGESGDQLYFEVEDDLTLTTICHIDDDPGQSVLIGSSTISYADGKFHWALMLESQIPITYIITDITTTDQFVDPLEPGADGMTPPRVYPALQGMVEQFTTPTDVYDETAILTSLTAKKVEVVLEVTEL